MGLDDFFEQGHKRHHYGNDHDYEHHDDYKKHYGHHADEHQPVFGHTDEHRPSYGHGHQNEIQKQILEKLQNNPGIKKMLIVGAIIVLVIVLLLVILLFPFILKLLGFVTDNGVQGVLDAIWKGAK